jgi:uncharacterized protein (TIGR03382 family)
MLYALFIGAFGLAQAQEMEESGPANVVGGSRVSSGDWEDTVSIWWGNSTGCTGVLIAPDVVMTAGHCMGGITRVRVGTNDYYSGGEFIRVASEHEYPNSWTTVDIGVLVLEEESSYEPRTIAQDCVLDELHDEAQVQIVGFGAIDIWGNQYTNHLMEARTTVNDHDCSDLWSGCNGSVSPGGEISAGGGGIDACYGDSGGPLYLLTDKGDYLVGITSRSYANVWAPCEEGGIYGRPDYVLDWVETVTGRSLPEPDCGQDDSDGGSQGDGQEDDDGENDGTEDVLVVDAPALIVPEGGTASTRLSVSRQDGLPPGPLRFTIVRNPDEGEAEIDSGGFLRFTGSTGFVGEDDVMVSVSDTSGHEVVVPVQVLVAEREQGNGVSGCAAAENGLGLAPLSTMGVLLFGVGWRRRSTSRSVEPRP